MLPRIEHCILIGDHEQLRPQIANYELQSTNRRGEQYSLDVSLFERLIHPPYPWSPKLAYSTLEVQRRMHPSISELVRKTLYPRLKDHASVLGYPQVTGISKRLYWLDHTVAEAVHEGTSSHSNEYEVEVTAALLTHLVRQGEYQPGEIAVLTPYLGQFVKLKRRLASQFEITVDEKDADEIRKQGLDEGTGTPQTFHRTTLLKAIRLATVDNFQGEEAKVVVISLVRSNQEKRCGFLSTSNRINVLLSRARHGMYLIGDSTCYQSVSMWDAVLQILRQNDCIGTALTLQCPRHVNTLMEVASPDDFLRQSPEGGCDRKCAQRLDCGHSCPNKCHAPILHDAVFCFEPCPRSHKSCSHTCPKPCGEECGYCVVPIPDVLLACGHTSTEKCFIAQDTTLARCQIKVERIMPGCGHQVQLECHIAVEEAHCAAVCGALLPCGHNCRKPCHECNVREDAKISKTDHGKCTVPCGNSYNTCEHHCTEPCHRAVTECKPCKQNCNVFCNHSRCSKSCQEPCAPCAEICNAGCEHSGLCPLPCSVPCDLIPCSKRCEKQLKCGHQCPSVCGEQCPSEAYCQQCATETIKQKIVEYTEFSRYCDMDLDK
jgi:alpha-D-ribose 1-methylphosphonate 5-triphosphate synthase subunit PhnG